jgi:SAM-dependent methyltransferase
VNALGKATTRVRGLAYDAGVRAGIVPYRRRWALTAADWDREYGRGILDRYGDLVELARYSVLIGYVRHREGRPSILDVGCGTGLLRDRLPTGEVGQFVGIDPSAVAIETARGRGHENAEYHVAELPDPGLGHFDLVVCNEMLYYPEDLDALLAAIDGVLAPGGWLLTSIFRHRGDIALHRALAARFALVDEVEVVSRSGPGNAWRLAAYGRAGTG